MREHRKKVLREAFEAPKPLRKDQFFRTVSAPRISSLSFMLSQAGYIQKWIWVLSAVLFVSSLAGACFMERDILWVISSLIPFVALSIVTESSKANVYHMAELEMASRFSLKSIMLARMGVLGVSHFLLLCMLTPLVSMNQMIPFLQTGIYLLVPYLLTTVTGLWITRKIHGKEALYSCMGAAVSVSGINAFTKTMLPQVFSTGYFHWWLIMCFILTAFFIWELKKTIHQTEELSWSLL